jgi:hypothetical protein
LAAAAPMTILAPAAAHWLAAAVRIAARWQALRLAEEAEAELPRRAAAEASASACAPALAPGAAEAPPLFWAAGSARKA